MNIFSNNNIPIFRFPQWPSIYNRSFKDYLDNNNNNNLENPKIELFEGVKVIKDLHLYDEKKNKEKNEINACFFSIYLFIAENQVLHDSIEFDNNVRHKYFL